MRISAQMTIVFAAIFAAICFGVAIRGFMSLSEIADAAQLDDARGFAWFWAFLGAIGVAFGAVSFWIVRAEKDETGG